MSTFWPCFLSRGEGWGTVSTAFTVCFFLIVIFYDDVILKVVHIIDFRKKFPKGMVNAFYVI